MISARRLRPLSKKMRWNRKSRIQTHAISREQSASRPDKAATSVERSSRGKPSRFARADKQEPTSAGEEKGKAIRAAGDVINRCAVHRVHDPEERDEKGAK